MTVSSNQFTSPSINSVSPSTPQPNSPGGNRIVPTPASPSDWWKMLIAIAIGASGIWMVQQFGSESAARWSALVVLLAVIAYYETHGNNQFSSSLTDLLGSIR